MFYIDDSHFLVESFFNVFLRILFLLIALVLLFNGAVSFMRVFEGLDSLFSPGLQSTDFWLVIAVIGMIWCIDEGYSRYGPIF